MPLFNINQKNILFIHIPKTAGTALEAWLTSVSDTGLNFHSTIQPSFLKCTPQHLTYANLKLLLGNFCAFDYTFSVVRNPYKKLESEYFYETHSYVKKGFQRPDFSSWAIQQIIQYQDNAFHLDNHFRPQTDFLDEAIEVFKLESGLDFIIGEIAKKIAVLAPPSIAHKNVSVKEPIQWSSELLSLFNKVYENDFADLKYEKRLPTYNLQG